jgi:cellulose synthase/poly-beta-1,6-N-acetylglucosamine synthase-like glycosyltransferase
MTPRPTRDWPDWIGFDDLGSIAVPTRSDLSRAEVTEESELVAPAGRTEKRGDRTDPRVHLVTAATLLASPSQNGSPRKASAQNGRKSSARVQKGGNGTAPAKGGNGTAHRANPPVRKGENGARPTTDRTGSAPVPAKVGGNGTAPSSLLPVREPDLSETPTHDPRVSAAPHTPVVPESSKGSFDAPTVTVAVPPAVNGTRPKTRSQPRALGPVPEPVSGLTDLTPPTEAPTVLSRRQKVGFVGALVALVVCLVVAAVPTLVVVMAALVIFFIAANAMKLVLIGRALQDPHQVSDDLVGERIPEDLLPIYTILLPVYREASILTQLVAGIQALDYPEDRLDVKLLLEEDDSETRDAAAALDLPPCFDVLVVPPVGPTGKPRACNHGLAHARGAYLVIYDAEDRPEPDQLRKSVTAFWGARRDVVCFQAQLNYFNRSYNLLTRWFTAEYSVWFDQLLPGLQAMNAVIPLGGTSNHFVTSRLRLIGGWNSFNVTEDADLGLRIHLQGWKTAILETTTYEEATSRYRNWVRQRSRWVKGYMQTYLFHMRHPVRLARHMGAKSFTVFQLFFGAGTLCLLLNPLFWLLAVLWFATRMHLIESIFPWPVLYLGTIGLFVGNIACVLSVVSGCFGRRNYEDVKYALLVPAYWVLMSIGAWKALIQLFTKPSYWEKTEHGFCRYEDDDEPWSEIPRKLALVDVGSAS